MKLIWAKSHIFQNAYTEIMEKKLKKRKTLAYSILFWFSSHLATYAIPGDSFETAGKWMANQQLFPSPLELDPSYDNWSVFVRPLTNKRELIYTVAMDFGSESIGWEEIKIISTDVEKLNHCRINTIMPYLPYYFSESPGIMGRSSEQRSELCFKDLDVFWDRSEKLYEILKLVYGTRANTIMSDLKNAVPIKKGKWYFSTALDASESTTVRRKLEYNPINISIYKGKNFIYFLTPFSLEVRKVSNSESDMQLKNTLSELSKDETLFNSVIQQEKRKEQDAQRSQPLDI